MIIMPEVGQVWKEKDSQCRLCIIAVSVDKMTSFTSGGIDEVSPLISTEYLNKEYELDRLFTKETR